MFCPECGASVDESKSFCVDCGAQIAGTQKAPSQPVQQLTPPVPQQNIGDQMPAQPVVAPQAPKATGGHRRLWLVLGIIFAVVVVAGVATTLILALTGGGESPQSALETFGKEVSASGEDYSFVSSMTHGKVDELAASGAGGLWYDAAAKIFKDGIKVESAKANGGTATVKYISNADNKTYTATLVKEDGFWRVQEIGAFEE